MVRDYSDLKYRYGFLLASHKDDIKDHNCNSLKKWGVHDEGNSTIIYHYESMLNRYEFEENIVITIGNIFVAHGSSSLDENLRNFVEKNDWDSVDNLSGRFSLICFNKKQNKIDKLLTDPIGSRAIFYSTAKKRILSSHSTLLSEILNIEIDPIHKKFIDSKDYLKIRTKFLPADNTMYKNIYGMPANHFYCFDEARIKRFWPRKQIPSSSLALLFEASKEYFNNQASYYVAQGIKPIFGLTAGVDSRCVFAGLNSKNIHFKCLTWNRGLTDIDIDIINKIKKYIKSDNYILETDYFEDSNQFKKLEYYGYINRGMCRSKATLTAQTAQFVDANNVFVRGLGGEILRGMFNKGIGSSKELNNLDFAIKSYKTHRVENASKEFIGYVTESYNGFFDRMDINSQNLYNYDFGDLLYWEQRMSMWAASLLNECDPAVKNLAGINSRRMFQLAYGLSPRPRFKKNLILKIIAKFDKYLSELPYN